MMGTLGFDVQHALRKLAKDPRFVAAVLFSFGLGIGLNTAVFSVIDAVLLHPFPYKESDRLAILWGTKRWDHQAPVEADRLQEWRSKSQTIEDAAPFFIHPGSFALGSGQDVTGGMVGRRLFAVLGVRPLIGRTFAEDERGGDASAAIVSYGFWQSRLGGARDAVGKELRLNGEAYTVIGVMPRDFFFPDQHFQLWVPSTDDRAQALVRLKAGTTLEAAQAELDAFSAQRGRPEGARAQPTLYALHAVVVRQYELALWTLFGAVLVLLLIACVNVWNLLLARGVAKEKDIAIMAALGASRARVFRLLLIESLLLSVSAGVVGILCGWGSLRLLRSLALTDITRLETAQIDGRVLLFTLAVSILTGLITGAWPAWKAARLDLAHRLQTEAAGGTPGRGHRQLRDLLVSSETALAFVLLVGAGLLIASFAKLARSDWGFEPENLFAVHVEVPKGTWTTVNEDVSKRLSSIPGVTAVGSARGLPIEYSYSGARVALNGRWVNTNSRTLRWVAGSGYFRTMGIPLFRGREFDHEDETRRGERLVVISRSLARRLWPGQDPVGRSLETMRFTEAAKKSAEGKDRYFVGRLYGQPESWEVDGEPWRVIGEVGDVRTFGLQQDPEAMLYVSYAYDEGWGGGSGYIVVRVDPQSAVRAENLKNEVASTPGIEAVRSVFHMGDVVSQSIGGRGSNKLLLVVSTLLGSLALLLATAGVYSVMSLAMRQQTRDMAIRRALGAPSGTILKDAVRSGMRPVAFGLGLGLVSAMLLLQGIQKLLFKVTLADPLVLSLVVTIFAMSACAACLAPALRALADDPATTLRHQ